MVDIRFRYKVALSCIVIMMVFVTLSGFSYAYFVAEITGESKPLTITTEGVKLTLTGEENVINLTNEKPTPDSDALKNDPYTFTLTNTNSYDVTASVYLSVSNSSTLDASNIKYAYVSSGSLGTAGTLLSSIEQNVSIDSSKYKNSYLLGTISLTHGESQNGFKLLLWIDNDLNEVVTCNEEGLCSPSEPTTMGKTFEAFVTVKAEPKRDPQNQAASLTQGVDDGPQIFDDTNEISGANSEVNNELEVVNGEESEIPNNDVPIVEEPGTEEISQNGEGMEEPSIG